MKQLSAASCILIVTLSIISMAAIILLYQNSDYRMENDALLLENDSLRLMNEDLSNTIDSVLHGPSLSSFRQ
jgi:hypothetical protein